MIKFYLGSGGVVRYALLFLALFSVGTLSSHGAIRDRIAELRTLRDTTGTMQGNAVDKKEYISIGNAERFYLLHIPRSYNKAKGAPLVLAFHGGMGSAQNMKIGYDILKKSDKEGFIVAFPNGTSRVKSGNFATWNAGNCCGYAVTSASDDVAFTKKIIEKIQSEYQVTKVFAMGMSNGAMFSYRLACDIPEYFDAIGAVAGTDNTLNCTPKESTPIMHIHAINDDHILYYGGKGSGSVIKDDIDFVSVPATIEKWKSLNQCSDTPTRVRTGSGVVCDLYKNCQSGSSVKLCTTETGGHSWPGNGNRANPRTEGKEPPSQAINATNELWNFFRLIK